MQPEMKDRHKFGSVIAFGASQVDPSIVGPNFVQRFYDAAIVRNHPSFRATSGAFSRYVGEHTDIFHMENGHISRFISAPYSKPQGVPEMCCGQEMEFRKAIKKRGGGKMVKFRCRLRDGHTSHSRTRWVLCNSMPGTREVIHKDGHRFMILHSSVVSEGESPPPQIEDASDIQI